MSYVSGISQQTIDVAANTGDYSFAFIESLQSTMSSMQPKDVVVHRGVQNHLKTTQNYNSPLYYKNNSAVMHYFDDPNNCNASVGDN